MRLIEKAFHAANEDLKLDWDEISGSHSNPLILDCYECVDDLGISGDHLKDIDDSEIPWCSCYMNKKIQDAGGKGTRSGMARSWMHWGNPSNGKKGDIAVLSRGNGMGHVAMVVEICEENHTIKLLGGNQGNTVSIHTFPLSRVLGYRTSKD